MESNDSPETLDRGEDITHPRPPFGGSHTNTAHSTLDTISQSRGGYSGTGGADEVFGKNHEASRPAGFTSQKQGQ